MVVASQIDVLSKKLELCDSGIFVYCELSQFGLASCSFKCFTLGLLV